jgi:spore maturation protein CgeB
MHLVVFGLTISSTWGNGHATLWRALCRALAARGHRVTFFERDVPYYASQRDAIAPHGCDLRLYSNWDDVLADARAACAGTDVAMITSYCPDGIAAARLALGSKAGVKVFYDMDTPVTLKALERGEDVFYVPAEGLGSFDLVLSFTGGEALTRLRNDLGARRVAPLYGCVDPDVHRPMPSTRRARALLSYIGTYAPDRQERLDALFLEPARRLPQSRFVLAGSQYPHDFPWGANTYYVRHLPAGDHPAFFADAKLTLNITRGAMAELGYCPSPRLFEASACGAALLSDTWEGLDRFFAPGTEVLVARNTDEALAALEISDGEARRIGAAARERTLAEHTAEARVRDLEAALEAVSHSVARGAMAAS